LLITLGASLNLQDSKNQNTPLHWAIYSRNSNGVSLLLAAGANVFIQNANGDTPSQMARRLRIIWLANLIEERMEEKTVQTKPLYIRIFKDKVIF